MDRSHQGKVAVITGAAQGLGRAFAERLAQEGAQIVAIDQRSCAETLQAVAGLSGNAIALACDVAVHTAIAETMDQVRDRMGRCDILINNAGVFPSQTFAEISPDDWRHVMAINVDAPFHFSRAAVGGMKERGWGRIINISSGTIGLAGPGSAHYLTSKMAIVGLTRALATEFGDHGITVNAIAPGLVQTPGTTERFAGIPGVFEKFASKQVIRRPMMPHDLVGTVSFLASDDAAFLTGQTLFVDGGVVRT